MDDKDLRKCAECGVPIKSDNFYAFCYGAEWLCGVAHLLRHVKALELSKFKARLQALAANYCDCRGDDDMQGHTAEPCSGCKIAKAMGVA